MTRRLALGSVVVLAVAAGGAALLRALAGGSATTTASGANPTGAVITGAGGRPPSEPARLAAARGCTLYVGPSGRASASGRSRRSPTALLAAPSRTRPGSVVCLERGTYRLRSTLSIRRPGAPHRPVVYRSRSGRARDVRLRWMGSERSRYPVQIDRGAHHVVIAALTIDGRDTAAQGVKVNRGAAHVTIRSSIIRNTGSAGIGTKSNDYVTAVGNFIHHTGYDPRRGWSSGITFNELRWQDRAPGFHSYIVGNVISGSTDESFHHSEGNGIIVDRTAAGRGDAPPTLVADNVVFANGSSCIKVLQASHVWAVDNTCFKNGLDRRQRGPGELTVIGADSVDVHLIDNVAYASAGRDAFVQRDGAVVERAGNVAFGGVPEAGSGGVRRADPRFSRPPYVDDARAQQQRVALAPWYARRGLAPRAVSPLVNAGIDPLLAPGVTAALRTGLRRFLREDVAGHARPRGAGWDVGAYEVR